MGVTLYYLSFKSLCIPVSLPPLHLRISTFFFDKGLTGDDFIVYMYYKNLLLHKNLPKIKTVLPIGEQIIDEAIETGLG